MQNLNLKKKKKIKDKEHYAKIKQTHAARTKWENTPATNIRIERERERDIF